MPARKKLIEVALPLEAINRASAREKSIRHGHPSTLHLWWARRPLAACRAVLFAQLVDDPESDPELKLDALSAETRESLVGQERSRLHALIEELVKWENTTNETVLRAARAEIARCIASGMVESGQIDAGMELPGGETVGSVIRKGRAKLTPTAATGKDLRAAWIIDNAGLPQPEAVNSFLAEHAPAFHDPFAGGGSIPLEAQRLGLRANASDLNPVAVLINKAMIEIPPKFAGRPPVNPEARRDPELFQKEWKGAKGLAEDVRYYGRWMRDEAEKRIGHLYPKVEITPEMASERPDLKPLVGQKLTVIAWLWARTVNSPNPAFAEVEVPLASTFMLSTRPGKEAYVEPVIEGDSYRFTVKVGKPKDAEGAKNGTKLARGANFRCLLSGAPIEYEHIASQGKAGQMGERLMAVVAEGERARVFLPPCESLEAIAHLETPQWKPESEMPMDRRWFSPPLYGMKTHGDLFTSRQLVALVTFSSLVDEARQRLYRDAVAAGVSDDPLPLQQGGKGPKAYSEAVSIYLCFAMDKLLDTNSSVCTWQTDPPRLRTTFGRQALPMAWDYAEANVFGEAAGDYNQCVRTQEKVIEKLGLGWGEATPPPGLAAQQDATQPAENSATLVSTDPPYYDNIGYADLSDFFYVWMRKSIGCVYPELFATLNAPKTKELVASSYRHGSKQAAERFFLEGMAEALGHVAKESHSQFPITIYYAFKQTEKSNESADKRTGWETFLDAVIRSGLSVSGTWPVRTEWATRNVGREANALATSIVLVCRPRSANALSTSRRDFLTVLKGELPHALANLQAANIAPVDLAQAAIGPGMAVFTRYAKVLDAQGKPLSVREALAIINQTLDEALAEQEGDFDANTRWALAWFDQHGFAEGDYGVAETLSKAKNTSVGGMVQAGIVVSGRGKVRLLKPEELPAAWDPSTDARLTAWETVHHLIRALETAGEAAAAALIARLGSHAETARELCYRLYTVCERKKRAAEALSYNALVLAWPELSRLAMAGVTGSPTQQSFLDGDEAEE